jgi:hypothetical protein
MILQTRKVRLRPVFSREACRALWENHQHDPYLCRAGSHRHRRDGRYAQNADAIAVRKATMKQFGGA